MLDAIIMERKSIPSLLGSPLTISVLFVPYIFFVYYLKLSAENNIIISLIFATSMFSVP